MEAKVKSGSRRITGLKAEQDRLAREIGAVDSELEAAKRKFEDLEAEIREENLNRGIRQVESDLQKKIASAQSEFRKKNAWLPEKKATLESQKAEIDRQLREAETALADVAPASVPMDLSSPAMRSLNEARMQLRNLEEDQQLKVEAKTTSRASQISYLKFSIRELQRQLDGALQEQMSRLSGIDKRMIELIRVAES